MNDDAKIREAFALLKVAELFFDGVDNGERWNRTLHRTLNLNDTLAWACADGEFVPDECAVELRDLFLRYGHCGVLYWVSERRGGIRTEFADVNRFIGFVRQEEAIRKLEPDSSKRAYAKLVYTLGE